MNRSIRRPWWAGLIVLPFALVTASASGGPLMLIGDAADDHGSTEVYSGLFESVLANVTNFGNGILAVGVDPGSPAATWILDVSAQLTPAQPIYFVNDQTLSVIGFSGYALIFVPSDSASTEGGISPAENAILTGRAADIASFVDGGGGLIGLTQGELPDAYGYVADIATVETVGIPPSGLCNEGEFFDDVSATVGGEQLDLTDTNIDGCCWHTVFTSFPSETLGVLASADEPGCSNIDGEAAILTNLEIIDFEEPQEFPAAGEPNVQALGDLDTTEGLGAQNTVDVAVTIPAEDPGANGLVQIFLNNGDDENGEWQGLKANEPFEVGPNPSSVAVGLFNDDSHLDLVVANAGNNTVSILFNAGDGQANFVLNQVIEVGNQPSVVITGSFNEPLDTSIDIAVANELDNNITLLFNDGTGNFPTGGLGPGTEDTGGSNPFSLEPEDVDNDKCLDMVGVNNQSKGLGPAAPGSVFVLIGLGNGEFEPAVIYEIGGDPRDLSLADLNRDGFVDITAVNAADATVSILINQGDGTFVAQTPEPVGDEPRSIDAADLDGDLDPDLVVVAIDPLIGPGVQVLENLLAGNELNFDEPRGFSVDADPNFVVAGTMNDDPLSDIVTVNADTANAQPAGSVSVLLNSPSPVGGSFFLDIRPSECPNRIIVGDDDDDDDDAGLVRFILSQGDDDDDDDDNDLVIALGSAAIDVTTVDFSTILLSRADGVGGSLPPEDDDDFLSSESIGDDDDDDDDDGPEFDDVATPFDGLLCGCHRLGADGVLDMVLHYRVDEVADVLELEDLPDDTEVELKLSFALLDETPLTARDCVVIKRDCCDGFNGKPSVVTMQYTADDCSATNHVQDPDKVSCDDFDPLPDDVFILSTDKADPNDGSARIWFEDDVSLDELYDIDAANAGQNTLKSTTFIHVFDAEGGTLLQTIKFHTSCSQPLVGGDQFGSSMLIGCMRREDSGY